MPTMSRAAAKGLAAGLGAGVMSGLFGVGGGVVLVPLLVLWLAQSQHVAHATSLAAIILTAASGAVTYGVDGSVDYTAGVGIAVGAMIGAFVGAAMMHRLSPERLRQVFAVLLIIVSLQLLLGLTPQEGAGLVAVGGAAAVVAYVTLGLLAGTLSAVMGVGGGVILVPAMVLLFGFGQHLAEGTSLLIIIPTAIVGAVRHSRRGYTDWSLGLVLGIGGVIGATAGASVALRLDADLLQRLFAAFVLVVAVRMWRRTWRSTDEAGPTDAAEAS